MTTVFKPGPRNLISDVPGITVGHATDETAQTGVTVVRCETSIAGAVDVRGGGPGTRETEVLAPENLVRRADAIVLTGGSVFGLAAADGVTWALSQQGVGLQLQPGAKPIPIVPAAVLHDLSTGGPDHWGERPPYYDLGAAAVDSCDTYFDLGAVGAGTGAMAGLDKGGIGSASLLLDRDVAVGAVLAVNPVGSPYMPDGQTYWAWPLEMNGEFGGVRPSVDVQISDPFPARSRLAASGKLEAGGNTTLGVVATNALLTASECKRIAIMAQDGIARAVRPAHTPFDGDTLFAISTGTVELARDARHRQRDIAMIGSALADCVARAIARGVYEAGTRDDG